MSNFLVKERRKNARKEKDQVNQAQESNLVKVKCKNRRNKSNEKYNKHRIFAIISSY